MTRIRCTLTSLTAEEATALLNCCGGEVKTAIVSHRLSLSPEQARELLMAAKGHLRKALESGVEGNGKP